MTAEKADNKPVVFIGDYELSDTINDSIAIDKESVAGRIYRAGSQMTNFAPQRPYVRCDMLVRSYRLDSKVMTYMFREFVSHCPTLGSRVQSLTVRLHSRMGST